jgi:hypothetical protein
MIMVIVLMFFAENVIISVLDKTLAQMIKILGLEISS